MISQVKNNNDDQNKELYRLIYQIFHLGYRPIYRPRDDISAHIGPKWYPINFCTYRIILNKIPISQPIYRYIGRYLKQCHPLTRPNSNLNSTRLHPTRIQATGQIQHRSDFVWLPTCLLNLIRPDSTRTPPTGRIRPACRPGSSPLVDSYH